MPQVKVLVILLEKSVYSHQLNMHQLNTLNSNKLLNSPWINSQTVILLVVIDGQSAEALYVI